jgi:hypothetical protein
MRIYDPHGDVKNIFHANFKSQIKLNQMQPNMDNLECPQMAPITSYPKTLSENPGVGIHGRK